nr:acyltransferase [Nodosilinea sp. TSF1-S3]
MNCHENLDQQQPAAVRAKANRSSEWGYRRDEYLLAILGVVPMGVGKRLRQLAYSPIFGKFGKDITIEFNVRFIRPKSMFFGNSCSICNYSFLNCWEDDGELVLEDSVRLDQGFHLQALGGKVRIGQNTYLGPYVCMAGPGNITIGKNCLIASNTSLYANNHIFSSVDTPINQQGITVKGIEIEEDCWLGSGVKVVDGVTIGRGSVIGAGSVVTKDIPPYSVAVGVPAKVIRQRTSSDK